MILSKIKWSSKTAPLFIYLVVLAIALLLTQDWFFSISPIKQLELKLIDDRFSKRGKIDIEDSSDIIILEIDQSSFDQIPPPYNKKWPWPRSIFARVVENLTEAGVKAIGLDINFVSPDQFDPLNDSLLIQAIRNSGKVVVAGKVDDYRELQIETGGKRNATKFVENFSNVFFHADSSFGIVQPPADIDKVFRRYLPYLNTSHVLPTGTGLEILIPSFGYAILNKYYNISKFKVAEKKDGSFELYDKQIPAFDNYSVLINFYGPGGSFKRIPIADVLDDKDFNTIDEVDGVEVNTWDSKDGLLDSGIFKDKIVLIGSTMPEERDFINTSFSAGKNKSDNQMYGVEFHANAIQNVIWNDFLERQSKFSEIIFVTIFCGIIFWGTSLLRKIKLRYGFIIELFNLFFALTSIYAIYQLGVFFFIHQKIVTAVVSPSIGVILGYFGSTAFHFLKERKQNVIIKGMFSQYVNKYVVQELLSNPDKLKLGGEKKNVTILFSDMAGFTSFSENKTPEELVKFINGLLNEMTELIMINTGTLDKYLGDAVMAFWGAPLELNNHAYLACKTAVEMQKKVELISNEWIAKGEKPLHIRIGLNSGDVIVGNVGGEKHKNYTVMGDSVNLASRLEGANKEYGTEIMISESTYEAAKEYILVRELDSIKVKGKSKPTKVFELIGLVEDKTAQEKLNSLAVYELALKHYKERKFSEASALFEKCYFENNDYTSGVYLERCKFYIENLPGENWDGVYIMKTK